MDGTALIGAALGGAFGGALGGLIGLLNFKREGKSALRTGAAIIPVVVCAQLGSSVADSQDLRDWISPPTRIERATRAHAKELQRSDAMKRHLAAQRSAEEARASAEKLSHAGLRRLSEEDLVRWNLLRQTLAAKSPALCSGFWTGRGMDRAAVEAGVNQLGDTDLDEWMRISLTAARLEVEASAPVPAQPDALERALGTVLEPLPEADRERMRRAFAAGEKLADDEACWALTTLLKTTGALEPKAREGVLRALAAI